MHTAVETAFEDVDPADLSPADRDRLTDHLFGIHEEIFDGVSRDAFRAYVVDCPAERNRISLTLAPDGSPGGYCAVHCYERQISGRPCLVIRIETGARRMLRGTGSQGRFIASLLVRERLRHPTMPMFIFACPVHPSSYVALARRFPEVWPDPEREMPAPTRQLLLELGDAFGLECVDAQRDPLIRKVGWVTRSTEAENDYWRNSEHRAARYYAQRNPGYVDGHGMLILVPISVSSMSRGIGTWGLNQVRRRALKAQGRVDRATRGRSADPSRATEAVCRSPIFTGLDAACVLELVKDARVMTIPAGEWVFRRGDRGDAMYVVESGSAYVQVGERPNVQILDQLRPGDVVGEVALVSGTARSADVRAASTTSLLRIGQGAIERWLDRHPDTQQALWRNVAWIAFDNFDRDRRELRADRRRRFDAGHPLQPGDAVPESGEVFVYHGAVTARSADGPIKASAPTLLPAALELEPGPEARCWWLPAHEPRGGA